MTVETDFTPLASAAGGALIGASAVLLMVFNGRVAGISGIVGGLLAPRRGDTAWRIAFLLGMLASPVSFVVVAPAGFLAAPRIDAGYGSLVAAGLLVGFGTRYGSGCTSGHGVCGLSRLSLRSLVATLAFMATGFLTVLFIRHA